MPPKANEREAVKVSIRLRPMSEKEINAGFKKIVEIDKKTATVKIQNPQNQTITFTFDYGFPEDCTQEEVYEATAAPIVSGVLEGFNGTIFAYGQTGTGKTYSMDGKTHGEHRGIMPRAFDHIFEYIQANQDSHEFLVTVTYVEIYNNELRDLLAENHEQPLKIREDAQKNVYIKGVCTHKVKSVDELHALLAYGKKNRVVRKTNMNSESSRSHSILSLVIETLTKIDGQDHVRSARLNMVDLAGSERAAKTGAEGVGFTEGVNINYELMILGNCIAALTSKGSHIPYRDSKLTMLLKDSLGGNARTMMIAALGPADYNFSETMSTLRYAERAKKIENKPKVNMDPKDALLLQLKEELAALESQIQQKDQLSAQMGASDDVIAMMEAKLEEERAEIAKQSNMAEKERIELTKKMEQRLKEIEAEKAKRESFQAKLEELTKALETSNKSQLMQRTTQNEKQIEEARKKLAMREEKSRKMQEEMEARRRQQEEKEREVSSLAQNVENVVSQFQDLVDRYKNLKVMLPEVQKTINGDRVQLAEHQESLAQQLDLLQQIVDNFIPPSEVERVKNQFTYDKDSDKWNEKSIDKKELVSAVLHTERPKSALGGTRPLAKTGGFRATTPQSMDGNDLIENEMPPAPVPSRLRQGPKKIPRRLIGRSVEVALKLTQTELTITI